MLLTQASLSWPEIIITAGLHLTQRLRNEMDFSCLGALCMCLASSSKLLCHLNYACLLRNRYHGVWFTTKCNAWQFACIKMNVVTRSLLKCQELFCTWWRMQMYKWQEQNFSQLKDHLFRPQFIPNLNRKEYNQWRLSWVVWTVFLVLFFIFGAGTIKN